MGKNKKFIKREIEEKTFSKKEKFLSFRKKTWNWIRRNKKIFTWVLIIILSLVILNNIVSWGWMGISWIILILGISSLVILYSERIWKWLKRDTENIKWFIWTFLLWGVWLFFAFSNNNIAGQSKEISDTQKEISRISLKNEMRIEYLLKEDVEKYIFFPEDKKEITFSVENFSEKSIVFLHETKDLEDRGIDTYCNIVLKKWEEEFIDYQIIKKEKVLALWKRESFSFVLEDTFPGEHSIFLKLQCHFDKKNMDFEEIWEPITVWNILEIKYNLMEMVNKNILLIDATGQKENKKIEEIRKKFENWNNALKAMSTEYSTDFSNYKKFNLLSGEWKNKILILKKEGDDFIYGDMIKRFFQDIEYIEWIHIDNLNTENLKYLSTLLWDCKISQNIKCKPSLKFENMDFRYNFFSPYLLEYGNNKEAIDYIIVLPRKREIR